MKKLLQSLLCVGFLLSLPLIACGATLPDGAFVVGEIKIGETTLNEIQGKYGKAKPYRTSRKDEADEYICYVIRPDSRAKHYVVFETGAMGGYERITGFRLTTKAQKPCVASVDGPPTKTGNGVALGEPYEEFLAKFGLKFQEKRSGLVYEDISKREATPAELERLRKIWPGEKETRFDVSVTIRAKFRDRHLEDYYIRKIESY